MGEHSDPIEEHLLSLCQCQHQRHSGCLDRQPQRTTTAHLLAKWVIKIAIVLIFALWVTFIFLFPSPTVTELYNGWLAIADGTTIGSTFLVFTGPVLAITCLAIAYEIVWSGLEEFELLQMKTKPRKHPRLRLSTFPVLVNGPFGVVSAAELIGICLVVVYVMWALYAYALEDLSTLSESDNASATFLQDMGQHIGNIGECCLAFLFLPVTRGSVLLRIINIPFEKATRYHVWLGHLTMALFAIHSLCYVISWTMLGTLLHQIVSIWKGSNTAILPGVIALLPAMLMWVTSLPPVRKKQFEVFFYTHQLYIMFVILIALHTNSYIFAIASGGIFLFMLDRFLRFCQSRRTVDIISATRLPCGIIELVLSKPANIQYNALSCVFLQIRELSWSQWHPFSVSSSPLDGKHHLSVHIKVLGKWTDKLGRSVTDILKTNDQDETAFHQPALTASVEGPYGPEFPYHLMYEHLVLVAGGIGVTPFLAIISDILHRVGNGKPCLPRKVLLVWAIKRSDELPLLSTPDMQSICPFILDNLSLEVDIYITQESGPSVENGNDGMAENLYIFPISKGSGMSVLVGTGNKIWSGFYVMTSIVGFVMLEGLVEIFYIQKLSITSEWCKGLIFVLCMLASVVLFGGFAVLLWSCWEKHFAIEKSEDRKQNLHSHHEIQCHSPLIRTFGSRSVTYGSRPNFREIFGSVSDRWGHVDIGVIVCGPATLETSVSRECRSQSLKRGSDCPIFHYHSLSFNL